VLIKLQSIYPSYSASGSRLLCFQRRLYWKALKYLDYFFVRRLPKITVIESNRSEELVTTSAAVISKAARAMPSTSF
jgi:hypothetical protein